MPKKMFVYIMANNRPTLYVGVTDDLRRRIFEHKSELKFGFTKKYHIHNLVYYEVIEGQIQAIVREKQIKDLDRKDKLLLIRQVNSQFKDLSNDLEY